MKKNYLYALSLALVMGACTDHDILTDAPSTTPDKPVIEIPGDAEKGELIVKFAPEMSDILDQTLATTRFTGGVATRSGIPSTDEVLEILGAYHFERVFPVNVRTEDKARTAGLHLWYEVKFDEDADLQLAAERLSKLAEVSKIQANRRIRRAYDMKPARRLADATVQAATRAVKGALPFNDEKLQYQWNYINNGNADIIMEGNTWAEVKAGSDAGCEEAWKLCTGNPDIIVAVLDEGVMFDHPDLAANMWRNEGETYNSTEDNDGNGYKGDYYGFNFVKMSPNISYSSNQDTGHGTHVAGTIAAVNNNGMGVSGIAGGNYAEGKGGVRIMSLQVFDGENGVTIANEAKAMKYAADNGAVILQCSWGYNSSETNPIFLPPGPATVEEWMELYPLEKECIDYFIANAGSPNGVIEGGLVIFAAGNESAGAPGFPGAYEKCISVGAVAADFTPSTFSNFGKAVDLSAPGGDMDYYGIPGYQENIMDNPAQGSILSTWVNAGQAEYGYMDGTSMACPTVSGVAALGLSYALEQHRHYTAEEFKQLIISTGKDLDGYFKEKEEKIYHYNHVANGSNTNVQNLLLYVGKMGKLVDAAALLQSIGSGENGKDMIIPNVYIAPEATQTIRLDKIFDANSTFAISSIEDANIATVELTGSLLKITGLKAGITHATISISGKAQTITITVRKGANDNGWM